MIEWAIHNDYKFNRESLISIASAGNLGLLQWAWSLQNVSSDDDEIIVVAIENPKMVEWLYEQGQPITQRVASMVALTGNLPLLKWIVTKDCPLPGSVFINAAKRGHLDIFVWASENDINIDNEHISYHFAIRGGYLPLIQWFHAHKYNWTYTFSITAALYGHLNVLQWAHENDLLLNDEAEMNEMTIAAAYHGYVDILQWLYDNGRLHLEKVFSNAVEGDQPNVIQWCKKYNIE